MIINDDTKITLNFHKKFNNLLKFIREIKSLLNNYHIYINSYNTNETTVFGRLTYKNIHLREECEIKA